MLKYKRNIDFFSYLFFDFQAAKNAPDEKRAKFLPRTARGGIIIKCENDNETTQNTQTRQEKGFGVFSPEKSMKYILVIGDGMADNPLKVLGGETPLQAANIPAIDRLAAEGTLGSVLTVPEGFPPGSDTAIMSIFGSAPQTYYAGRAPLEAAAQGVELGEGDAAMRCNNVALSEGAHFGDRRILSHSGGGIEGEDGRELVTWLFAHPDFRPLAEEARMEIYPTDSYRHIAVLRGADIRGLTLSPPHNHIGETVSANLPSGSPAAAPLCALLERACALLEDHPLNRERAALSKLPANGIWFWAGGTAARLQDFTKTYGKTGAVVSAVPLCHGIAKLSGLDVLLVPGATGELHTNYEGKVAAALGALDTRDFVAVHLEGPDECSHAGDLPGKLQAIEWLDSRVVAPLTRALEERGEDFRLLLLSDHKTLLEERGAHGGGSVPFLLYDSRKKSGSNLPYCEESAKNGPFLEDGTALMPLLFAE